MKFLAIDTSTDACSVALQIDGSIISDHRVVARQHGALVLPMVDALMAQAGCKAAELDALIYGRGPGSFTGVRIGIATAQGIALGADIGVVGVSTLQSIAQACWREYADESVAVSVDARMDEVYFCKFFINEKQLMQSKFDEQIGPPEQVRGDMCAVWAGSGAERYSELLQENAPASAVCVRSGCLPNAVDLLTLGADKVSDGQLQAAEFASPVYLRNKVALTTAERGVKQ